MCMAVSAVFVVWQARELRAARTGPKHVELERRTDVFLEKWVEEAAAKYLAKRNGHPGLQ